MNIPDILIPDLISKIEGLAPHSYFMTKKALSYIEGLHKMKRIADIGCGVGYQSVVLLETTNAAILAVDHRIEYIRNFREELKIQKLDNQIFPIYCRLDRIPFKDGELDMVWSESLVVNVGFEQALKDWGRFVKDQGYIVLCAYCRNSDNLAEEVSIFFEQNNIEIESISDRLKMMNKYGFMSVSHFVMPDECWWNYFCPIYDIGSLQQVYSDNCEVQAFAKGIDEEISLFERYGDTYSYVFFVGRKNI